MGLQIDLKGEVHPLKIFNGNILQCYYIGIRVPKKNKKVHDVRRESVKPPPAGLSQVERIDGIGLALYFTHSLSLSTAPRLSFSLEPGQTEQA